MLPAPAANFDQPHRWLFRVYLPLPKITNDEIRMTSQTRIHESLLRNIREKISQ
jgi:hypothetical protein